MKRFLLILSGSLLITNLNAQWKKLSTIFPASQVLSMAVDRPGDFYLVDEQHNIRKYDRDGVTLESARFDSHPAVFDPRDGSRLFAFFPAQNSIAHISPGLSITKLEAVDSAYAIDPFLVCSSGDYHIVILDSADWSVKKVNVKSGAVVTESLLPDSIVGTYQTIREYQNFIFLLDERKGIHILNNMGKWLKTLPVEGVKGFNFLGEELYYVDGANLVFFDLFSAERRTQPLPEAVDMAIITDERLVTLKGNKIQIFAYAP
jgi:hypothetical protein